jgi:methyltransferase-like protein/SAM-dependent methyltransferase
MDMDGPADRVRAEYDAAPYGAYAYPQSAPGHLAAVAHLFGMSTPDVSTARVLEIGCATGSNLIPFAAYHPNAEAVGIDLSPVQIGSGRTRVDKLGLPNLTLIVGDIADMNLAQLGQFDYIVIHGVYSWVSDEVGEALLSAIRKLLVRNGVAYLSYNVYPGWKTKEVLRDAMLLVGGGGATAEVKVRAARSMINMLGDVAPPDSSLGRVIDEYQGAGGTSRDYYLLHDELSTFNRPCYFLEMVERARMHGLTYMAEARPETMFAGNYGDDVAARLNAQCGDSQMVLEQMLDFVADRTFRQSLLVHAECAPQIRYELDRGRYRNLHFAALLPAADGEIRLDYSRQDFGADGSSNVFTNDPALKAAIDALNDRWPWTTSWSELQEGVHTRLMAAGIEFGDDVASRVDGLLEVLILTGKAHFRREPVSLESNSGLCIEEPSRRMAEVTRIDANEAVTFNRWHEMFPLSSVDLQLIPLLDGTRDTDALVESLLNVARQEQLRFTGDDTRSAWEAEMRGALVAQISTMSTRLAEMKLCR